MKITPDSASALHYQKIQSKEIASDDLSLKTLSARDIIIINPHCAGAGDEALAKKIANIALNEGCRVTLSPISASKSYRDYHEKKYQHYSLQDEEPHTISDLKNPLFIIAPAGIIRIEVLQKHIESLCDDFSFSRSDAIIIEEMDILTEPGKELANFDTMLKNIGFTHVSVNSLGFAEGAIGYLPTDEKTINQIRDRFENDLTLLLDSYNISISSKNSYHLGYISSDCYSTGAKTFITNTLSENIGDERNTTFIMSIRLLNKDSTPTLIEDIADVLSINDDVFDNPALFSTATVTVINSESGDIDHSQQFTGCGKKRVDIILTNKLPKNIYDDFLLLADSGMTSGDQSLSEYLSVKGRLPYYDLQPWKEPLRQAIKTFSDPQLSRYLDTKFVGYLPFTGEKISSLIPNTQPLSLSPALLMKKETFDKTLSSYIATPHIRAMIQSAIER